MKVMKVRVMLQPFSCPGICHHFYSSTAMRQGDSHVRCSFEQMFYSSVLQKLLHNVLQTPTLQCTVKRG